MSKKPIPITLIIILGSLTAFAPLSIDMYLASMPTLEHYYSTTQYMIQLTLASFFIGFSLGQLFYGPLSDRFGRKPPLYIGLGLFVISSIGCSLAKSVEWMIFFRFIQALGACSGGVIVRAIIRDLFPPEDASRVFSYMMLVMGLAPMLAPVFGGYILMYLGWRAIFLTLALMGAVSIVAIYYVLQDSHRQDENMMFNFKSITAEYIQLLKHKELMGYALMSGFVMAGMFGYITSSSFVFIDHFKLSVEQYGIMFGLNATAFIVASQINARIVHKVKPKTIISLPIQLIVGFAFIMCLDSIFSFGGIYGILVPLLGCMMCIGFIVPNSTALAMAPFAKNAGSASALLGTLQFSMAAISSITLGFLQTNPTISMSVVIFICSVCTYLIYVLLIKKMVR